MLKGPWATIIIVAIAALAILGGGRVLGVGPLAAAVAPDKVTDPAEMLARSLQATIDASSVHLSGTVSGTIPGRLVNRPETAISLDGTVIDGDLRPKDGKTRAHVVSPGLDISFDTVTIWDGVWYRTAPDAPWMKASLGAASAGAGIDINPLTLVDRLRSYLATPGLVPTVRDVACGSASGRCHEVRLDAGSDPASILALLLPEDRAQPLPAIDVVITLQTDTATLRPAHLVLDAVSASRSVDIHLVLDASGWDQDLVIEQPSTGSG